MWREQNPFLSTRYDCIPRRSAIGIFVKSASWSSPTLHTQSNWIWIREKQECARLMLCRRNAVIHNYKSLCRSAHYAIQYCANLRKGEISNSDCFFWPISLQVPRSQLLSWWHSGEPLRFEHANYSFNKTLGLWGLHDGKSQPRNRVYAWYVITWVVGRYVNEMLLSKSPSIDQLYEEGGNLWSCHQKTEYALNACSGAY